jgi:hypothetical protein
MTHEASRSIKSAFRGSDNAKSAAGQLRAAVAEPNLFIILSFCAIGLLVNLNPMFRFPDFGIGVEQLEQFQG